MSLFDIFDSPEYKAAQSSKGGNYWKEGIHTAKISSVTLDQKRKGMAFIAECEVVESEAHQEGETVGWLTMDSTEMFFGNIKAFLGGVLGCPDSNVDREAIEFACGEDQPLVGTLVKVEAHMIKTKRGTDFTKVAFTKIGD